MTIERRPVDVSEISEFDEIGACGTAAVVTPVTMIHYEGKDYRFGNDETAGPVITKLYQNLTGIQYGDIEDKFNWLLEVK